MNSKIVSHVIVIHKYERTTDKFYQLNFKNKVQPYIGSVNQTNYLPFPLKISEITDLLQKHGIDFSITDRNKQKKLTIDRIINYQDVDEVIGYGTICMESYPCCHRLVVRDKDGTEVTIQYVSSITIKAIYDHVGQTPRSHIQHAVAMWERDNVKSDRCEQAYAYCLYAVEYNDHTDNKLVMMSDNSEQLSYDLYLFMISQIRAEYDVPEWIDCSHYYSDCVSELKEEMVQNIECAKLDGDSGWFNLTINPEYELKYERRAIDQS